MSSHFTFQTGLGKLLLDTGHFESVTIAASWSEADWIWLLVNLWVWGHWDRQKREISHRCENSNPYPLLNPTLLDRCENSKPYPLLNPALCPARRHKFYRQFEYTFYIHNSYTHNPMYTIVIIIYAIISLSLYIYIYICVYIYIYIHVYMYISPPPTRAPAWPTRTWPSSRGASERQPWRRLLRSVFMISNRKTSNWAYKILKTNMLIICPYCLKFQIARV